MDLTDRDTRVGFAKGEGEEALGGGRGTKERASLGESERDDGRVQRGDGRERSIKTVEGGKKREGERGSGKNSGGKRTKAGQVGWTRGGEAKRRETAWRTHIGRGNMPRKVRARLLRRVLFCSRADEGSTEADARS